MKDAGKLKPNEARFCAIYVTNGRNATRAYQAIYPNCRDNSASAKGSMWLRKVNIQAEIERLTQEQLTKEHMSAAEALAVMARIARVDPINLVWKPGELDSAGQPTVAGAIKSLYEMPESIRVCIKSIKYDIMGRPEFQFWSKDAQLTNIGKHHKLLSEQVNVNITLGFAERLRAAREKRLKGAA